jgi:hypothetical protein
MMMEETTTHIFFNYNADDRGSRGGGHRELQQQQQQNQNWNVADQQQQFEQNVQDLFGIGGGQMSSQANNNNEVAYNYNAGGQYDYNPFTDANTKDVNTSAFMTAVCLNAMLFVVLVVGYELFRRWLPTVYSPKSSGSSTASRSYSGSSGLPTSPTSHTSSSATTAAVNINTQKPLGWVTGVVRASWSTVRSSGGLDSYMFLRYIRLCFRISFTSALWGMIILWPGK